MLIRDPLAGLPTAPVSRRLIPDRASYTDDRLITALTEEVEQMRRKVLELESINRNQANNLASQIQHHQNQHQHQSHNHNHNQHQPQPTTIPVKHTPPPPQAISFNGYFAERMVAQLLNAQVGWSTSNQSLVATVAQQIGLPVRDVVNQPNYPYSIHVSQFPTTAALPPRQLAELMIERYLEFVNVFHPLLDPDTIRAE